MEQGREVEEEGVGFSCYYFPLLLYIVFVFCVGFDELMSVMPSNWPNVEGKFGHRAERRKKGGFRVFIFLLLCILFVLCIGVDDISEFVFMCRVFPFLSL